MAQVMSKGLESRRKMVLGCMARVSYMEPVIRRRPQLDGRELAMCKELANQCKVNQNRVAQVTLGVVQSRDLVSRTVRQRTVLMKRKGSVSRKDTVLSRGRVKRRENS